MVLIGQPQRHNSTYSGNSLKEDPASSEKTKNPRFSPSPPKNVKNLENSSDTSVKTKRTKSRNGCVTCKKKRLKCDETHPSCLRCTEKNIVCGGYATNFKWRSFNDEPFEPKGSNAKPTTLNNTSKKRKAETKESNQEQVIQKHLELASLSVTGKSSKEIERDYQMISRGVNPTPDALIGSAKKLKRSQSQSTPQDSHLSISPPMARSLSVSSPLGLSLVRQDYSDIRNSSKPTPPSEVIEELQKPDQKTNNNNSFTDLNLTPHLTALLNYAFTGSNEEAYYFGNDNKISDLVDVPLSPLALSNPAAQEKDNSKNHTSMVQSPGFRNIDLAHKFDPFINVQSPAGATPSLEFSSSQHDLLNSEQQQILFLYSQYTSSMMSIKNGPYENPWKSVIAPMAKNYPCLFDSIACMTLFHLAGNPGLEENKEHLLSRGGGYMKRCILELASGLSKMNDDLNCEKSLPADIALATCLNLAVSESFDTHTSSGIAHLKGAKSMIQKILSLFREFYRTISKIRRDSNASSQSPEDTLRKAREACKVFKKKLVLVDDSDWDKMIEDVLSNTCQDENLLVPKILQFLFNIWIYFEVLAQMTTCSNHDDKGIDLVDTITNILQETQKKRTKDEKKKNVLKMKERSPSLYSDSSDLTLGENAETNFLLGNDNLFENFDSFNHEYIDPLLGCAQSLFSIMGDVANLISKIKKSKKKDGKSFRNSLTTITRAAQLRQRIVNWKPSISASMIDQSPLELNADSGWDIPSCIASAEAYRYATLIYLHQAVPEIPLLASHVLAEKIFILLASIPTTSNCSAIHIFPLLVASCEAESGEEREWCEARWAVLAGKLWLGNIDRALEVVKEVWIRKDEYNNKRSRDEELIKFGISNTDSNSDIAVQLSGLMAAVNNESQAAVVDDLKGTIHSRMHWSTVMREWNWEILLG